MRYYVANKDGIPFHAQPENGYTKLQAMARIQREIKEDIRLFGGSFDDYKTWYTVLDRNFRDVTQDFITSI